jgi:predicted ArsR family transcriptional regulator
MAMDETPQTRGLEPDTIRVLVYLFNTEVKQERDLIAMSERLAMAGNVIRYHLDRLTDAGLADMESGKYVYGRVYWAPTNSGRKYIVERKLM